MALGWRAVAHPNNPIFPNQGHSGQYVLSSISPGPLMLKALKHLKELLTHHSGA